MANAIDIITYIGVPLAVLGVLPIIYTTLTALLVSHRIKLALSRNHVYPTTRASLMSRTVELEFPRSSITPLPRHHPLYWADSSAAVSTLPGGAWTLFNWDTLVTGHVLTRVHYVDEIRQPQAEVGFEELVAFLLDRGAVVDAEGWNRLKVAGLWTPGGTKLLKAPFGEEEHVLVVKRPDESDGMVSLGLQWKSEWGAKRDASSLPPYWMRITGLGLPMDKTADEEDDEEKSVEEKAKIETSNGEEAEKEVQNEAAVAAAATPEITTEKASVPSESAPTPTKASIRFRLSSTGIAAAYYESSSSVAVLSLPTPHLIMHNDHHTPEGLWFASAATALSQRDSATLWSYTIPSSLLNFSSKLSIPCGVMVILNLIDDNDTPPWQTHYDETAELQQRMNQQQRRQMRIMAEKNMAPAQAQAARISREAEERFDVHGDLLQMVNKRKVREHTRELEALNSPRLDNVVVAAACLKALKSEASVEEVLYKMLVDEDFAKGIAGVLEAWKTWSESGGMTREHFELLRKEKEYFLRASLVVKVLGEVHAAANNGLATDLKEATKAWPKVRLG